MFRDNCIFSNIARFYFWKIKMLIGELKTRFWYGEKYVFKRIAKGEWVCIYQDSLLIPHSIIDDLGD